jgi:hypothetical protein
MSRRVTSEASTLELHLWAPSGSNRRPTDQKSDRNPLGRLAIGQFVRGWLTLADSLEQCFSLMCATNVPRDCEARCL